MGSRDECSKWYKKRDPNKFFAIIIEDKINLPRNRKES